MKQMYLPTLSEMRDMLGEELYVKFVWMWREQEQNALAVERRARFAALLPTARVQEWPTPVFARAEDRSDSGVGERLIPTPAQALHAALLRAPRLTDSIDLPKLEGLLERPGANYEEEEPRELAVGGGRRRRR